MEAVFPSERAHHGDNHIVSVHESTGWATTPLHLDD
jgi:hypothetical protein